MNTFTQAIFNEKYNEKSVTFNGAATNASTSDKCLDLFSLIGSGIRQGTDITQIFAAAYAENPNLAVRIVMWARDIREGAGRREVYRQILKWFNKNYPFSKDYEKMIFATPEFGRWDDLFSVEGNMENVALSLISDAIRNGNQLAAKWADRKGPNAIRLRNFMKLSPKSYRKLLVNTTNVVETKMCQKDWENINFSQIPSLASSRYAKAFAKNSVAYREYLAQLAKNLADPENSDKSIKVNAGAVYPFDVIKTINQGNKTLGLAQWEALPNYLNPEATILPIVDVSGSMTWTKVQGNTTPLDVALSIGLYLADKQTGPFKDVTLTFSTDPKIDILKGDIIAKMNQLNRQNIGGSTDVEKAFELILDMAVKNKVKQKDMPKYLMIMSDMEFNPMSAHQYGSPMTGYSQTAMEMIKSLYQKAGYELPKIIFWNINGRSGNSPVKFDERGTAIVSGFSTAIAKSILSVSLENFTPHNVMLETVMKDRYNIWK
jgi:hypothetical protein